MQIGDKIRTRAALSSTVGEGAQGEVTHFNPRYDTWEVRFESTTLEVYDDEVYVVEEGLNASSG